MKIQPSCASGLNWWIGDNFCKFSTTDNDISQLQLQKQIKINHFANVNKNIAAHLATWTIFDNHIWERCLAELSQLIIQSCLNDFFTWIGGGFILQPPIADNLNKMLQRYLSINTSISS